MRELDAQKHRTQIRRHDRIPFLDGGLDQRLGDLQRCIVNERIKRLTESFGLLEDGFHCLGAGDV